MRSTAGNAGRVSPLALAILAALLVGLAAWATSWHRTPGWPFTPRGEARGPAPADTAVDDAAIGRALAMTTPDSAAIKSRWQDDARGIDYADLDPGRREIFLRFANAERCTCGCGYTIAGCLASDMTCEVSGAMARALLDSVRAGRIRSAKNLRARPASGG